MVQETAGLFSEAIIAPPSDRRLTNRILTVWAQTARGAFPNWADMRGVDLGDDWNWVFVVDLSKSVCIPHFVYLGSCLARLSSIHLQGDPDFALSLLDKAASHIDAAVAARSPQYRHDELCLLDGRKVMFRSMTAPLADDGETITHVLGCATGRFAINKPSLRVIAGKRGE
jgi:hypothetical protein